VDALVAVDERLALEGGRDDHGRVVVVVVRYQRVHDALGERMTDEIHAIELETYTPMEYED